LAIRSPDELAIVPEPAELGIARELGREPLDDAACRRPREMLDRPADQPQQLASRIAEIGHRLDTRRDVREELHNQLLLRAPAPVDGRLADARAAGDRLDAGRRISLLGQELAGRLKNGAVDLRAARSSAASVHDRGHWCRFTTLRDGTAS